MELFRTVEEEFRVAGLGPMMLSCDSNFMYVLRNAPMSNDNKLQTDQTIVVSRNLLSSVKHMDQN